MAILQTIKLKKTERGTNLDMVLDDSVKAPYHIAFAGSLLSVAESGTGFFLYDFYMGDLSGALQVSQTQWMIQSAIGLIIALGLTSYLYYHHRNKDLKKDSFLYIIIGSVLGLLLGGQLASIITFIGALICYRRMD